MTASTGSTASTDLRSTRDSYDAVAASYAELVTLDFGRMPLETAMLGEFVERVRNSGPVADLGCGPGHLTAHLNEVGVSAFGVDLSSGMVEVARKRNPRAAVRGRVHDRAAPARRRTRRHRLLVRAPGTAGKGPQAFILARKPA